MPETILNSSGKVAVVTGATSGLGRAVASRLSREGYTVYGTGRKLPSDSARPEGETGIRYVALDVLSKESVRNAFGEILSREKKIDVLVTCAGMGIAGSVEDTPDEDAELQMNVNFAGTLRTIRACLPSMRGRGSGKIIVFGSLAGRIGMPFQAMYSASKFALEGLVESLRYEIRRFGVQACILEPGDFRTGFTGSRKKILSGSGVYEEAFGRVIGMQEKDEMNGFPPEKAAKKVSDLLRRSSLPVRASVGPAFQVVAARLKGMMPASWFEAAYRLYYRP